MKLQLLLIITVFFLITINPSQLNTVSATASNLDPAALLNQILAELAKINDYKCILIKTEKIKDQFQTETIRYTFKRPQKILMEWIAPRKGLKVFFDGAKLLVNPFGGIKFYTDPHGKFGHQGSNHYIDESDLVSIAERIKETIRNHSVTYTFREEAATAGQQFSVLEIDVPQDDGTIYCHRAVIWIEPREKTPYKMEFYDFQDQLFESFIYSNLQINTGIPDQAFKI